MSNKIMKTLDGYEIVDAVARKELDNKLDKLPTTGANQVYGVDPSGQQVSFSTTTSSINGYSIVMRGENGEIAIGEPIADNNAATKKYVDDLVKDIPPTDSSVQSDWNQTDETQLDYIKNKPDIPVFEASINNKVLTLANSNATQGPSKDDLISTEDKYFDINIDGIISLKPEYRGDTTDLYAENYEYSISDNGIGVEGSRISELPERLVIPSDVDGEQVTGFQKGMFCHNWRIKEVVIPSNVKDIPGGMFRHAIYLEKVENTEQIETIGVGAFIRTRIKEIRFPNLKTLSNVAFQICSCLRLVDIGNITSINKQVFSYCENLTDVLGGVNVTSIGEQAFLYTRRLKTLPFLANLKNIGSLAFAGSRCDFDDVYDSLVTNNCVFGESATYKQFNSTNYWSGATFTPCKTTLNSLFNQHNPQWENKTIIGYPSLFYGSNGCMLIVLAEIYSAFENVSFNSPEEFAQIIYDKGLTPDDFRNKDGFCYIAEGLGYETEVITTMTTEGLQKVYDALSQGALICRSTLTTGSLSGGHTILGYGINTDGEMLTADSAMLCHEVGIYENHKSAWHFYKQGTEEANVIIVKKV